MKMKFFLNRFRLRNRRRHHHQSPTPNPNPNPNHTITHATHSEFAEEREKEVTLLLSSEISLQGKELKDIDGFELPNSEGEIDAELDTASFQDEDELGAEMVEFEEGDDRMLESDGGASSKSLIVIDDTKNEWMRMEKPPTDDCCPICFGNFVVPCRGPCGHWYCGGCILQYWNYGAALQPCNCPMCSRKITNLTPEASMYDQQDAEVTKVLKDVQKYNRLFVGGTYGLMLKLLGLPLYMKRAFYEMINPDRPGANLSMLRILAMFLGLLYTLCPFDFLPIGRQYVFDVLDYSAIALSSILYLVGLYLRRRRLRNVRDMAAINLDAN